jgi:hypothetical protein
MMVSLLFFKLLDWDFFNRRYQQINTDVGEAFPKGTLMEFALCSGTLF